LRDGQAVSLEVGGHSMTPFIRGGDRLTVRPRQGRRPSLGQVLVAAVDPGRVIVHRHVGWLEDRVVLRGDSTAASDAPIPLEAVVGVVARVERGDRRVWAALGPERRLVAWLSRRGLLGRMARLRARLGRTKAPDRVSGGP
jgi:hypothetical protein